MSSTLHNSQSYKKINPEIESLISNIALQLGSSTLINEANISKLASLDINAIPIYDIEIVLKSKVIMKQIDALSRLLLHGINAEIKQRGNNN